MKKWILLLFFFSILCFISANGNNIEFEFPAVVKFGETFFVNVTIETDEPVMGVQFNISFFGLEALSIEKGNFFDFWVNDFYENFTVIDNENNSIYNIVAFSYSPVIGNGTIVKICFKSIEEGFAKINLTDVILADENGNATNVTTLNASLYNDAYPPIINLLQYPPYIAEKNVTFSWNATDDYSSNISFSYRIDNMEWSEWSRKSIVNYKNLSYGSHIFQLKAKDLAGNIAWINYSFNVTDTNPPEIIDVDVKPITQYINGYVNISAIVYDESQLNVSVIIEYPDETIHEYLMNKDTEYYLNKTYSIAGLYHFYIYAKDEYGNENESSIYSFEIVEGDNIPPEIEDVLASPSLQDAGKEVTISCKVTDNIAVKDVFLNITYPDGSNYNFSIKNNKTDSIYYCNKAYNMLGTYSFFIFAEDEYGNKNKSSTYSFEIKNSPPDKPENVYPKNGATGVELNLILKWSCIDINGNALTYDVYFGEEGSINKIASNISANFFDISINLKKLTTYYWQVVAWDEYGAKNVSQIWHFTTRGNAPPVAVEDEVIINENGSIRIDVLANDYDINGDVLSIVAVTSPVYGIAMIEGSKIFYEPNKNFYGDDEFLYTITDGFVEVSAKIRVIVNALPIANFDYVPAFPSPDMPVNLTDKSYDKDGSIVNYSWVIGEKKFYGNKVSYSFAKEGNYTIKLIVTDNNGGKSEIIKSIKVEKPDFYISGISYEKVNGECIIKVNVSNAGGFAKNVNLSLFVNGKLNGNEEFDISKSKEITFSINLDKDANIKAIIDPDNLLEEKNEKNNSKEIYIKVVANENGNNYYYLLVLVPVIAFTFYLLKKRKKKILEEEAEEKCFVCLGKFKKGIEIIKCKCGALFHRSCAKRIKECPNCGRKLKVK